MTSTEGRSENLLELRALTKSYREGGRERVVLRAVDAAVAPGEFVVLMGRSGSGKSTLLNLVSGIDVPTRGQVLYGDTDLTALSERERTLFRRAHIGFVFQALNLISTLTVAENITLPLELAGHDGASERERVEELLGLVGLRERADSYPDRLSGGEQQRVAVARALAHDPLLVLADEPTGSLDYDTGQRVLDVLSELVRASGTTLLVATHDIALVERADRVLRLQGGTLAEAAPEEARAQEG